LGYSRRARKFGGKISRQRPLARAFGVRSNQIEFNFTGPANLVVVVGACSNLADPVWVPLLTNALTSGSFYFSEPLQTNGPCRYYRITSR
jgi:hypothetical protein